MWVSEVKTAPVSSRLRGHYEVLRSPAGPISVTVRNSCDTCVAAAPLSRCELLNIQFLRVSAAAAATQGTGRGPGQGGDLASTSGQFGSQHSRGHTATQPRRGHTAHSRHSRHTEDTQRDGGVGEQDGCEAGQAAEAALSGGGGERGGAAPGLAAHPRHQQPAHQAVLLLSIIHHVLGLVSLHHLLLLLSDRLPEGPGLFRVWGQHCPGGFKYLDPLLLWHRPHEQNEKIGTEDKPDAWWHLWSYNLWRRRQESWTWQKTQQVSNF